MTHIMPATVRRSMCTAPLCRQAQSGMRLAFVVTGALEWKEPVRSRFVYEGHASEEEIGQGSVVKGQGSRVKGAQGSRVIVQVSRV